MVRQNCFPNFFCHLFGYSCVRLPWVRVVIGEGSDFVWDQVNFKSVLRTFRTIRLRALTFGVLTVRGRPLLFLCFTIEFLF